MSKPKFYLYSSIQHRDKIFDSIELTNPDNIESRNEREQEEREDTGGVEAELKKRGITGSSVRSNYYKNARFQNGGKIPSSSSLKGASSKRRDSFHAAFPECLS